MDIQFRAIKNNYDEISMGHKLWFPPTIGCDAVSATANAPGFTPLVAIGRYFGWDYKILEGAASACNNRGEIAIVNNVKPLLLLVPATKGDGDTKFLIKDLLKAANKIGVEGLHFTHFGYLQGRFPEQEVTDILREILKPSMALTLKRLVFDIDERAASKLYELIRP